MLNFGYMQSQTLARISTLLDEANEEIEAIESSPFAGDRMSASIAQSKIREAQRLLLGDPPTNPEAN